MADYESHNGNYQVRVPLVVAEVPKVMSQGGEPCQELQGSWLTVASTI
jgi:hypothetical protein